jgi:FAD/FMN-containing dehydrogenase
MSDLTKLRARLSGHLVAPTDPTYDQARRVWNGMIDRRPAAIARCATVTDVATCMEFAWTADMVVAIRGGGHNVAGNAICDGGLVIDLSLMKEIVVDAPRLRVRAEAWSGC